MRSGRAQRLDGAAFLSDSGDSGVDAECRGSHERWGGAGGRRSDMSKVTPLKGCCGSWEENRG